MRKTTQLALVVPVLVIQLAAASVITTAASEATDLANSHGEDGQSIFSAADIERIMKTVPPEHVGDPIDEDLRSFIAGHKNFGSMLGSWKNHLLYLSSTKPAKESVGDVMKKLKSFKTKKKVTPQFVFAFILGVILIVVGFLLVLRHPRPGSIQYANVGLDDGKGLSHKRAALGIDGPASPHVVTWDLSSDTAHADANTHAGRPIVSPSLREQLLAQGYANVTFAHHDSPHGPVPVLHYTSPDNSNVVHAHFRPVLSDDDELEKRQNQYYTKHYPYFDSDGAGFKISAENPIVEGAKLTEAEAKPIAEAIAGDFVHKRTAAGAVGYHELVKTDVAVGHKLCIIAEPKRFGLKNELGKCFGG